MSGIVQERLFTEGGDVKAGEVLYRIDPATYQAAADSAKATLARAEAGHARREGGPRRHEDGSGQRTGCASPAPKPTRSRDG